MRCSISAILARLFGRSGGCRRGDAPIHHLVQSLHGAGILYLSLSEFSPAFLKQRCLLAQDGLPNEELLELYRDVTAQDDSPECFINTSMIISRTEAKQQQIRPPCDHDDYPMICGPMINAGAKSCEGDYCALCPEAHSCDASCELPCAEVANTGGGNRREMGEMGGWTSGIAQIGLTCPLETLAARVLEIDNVCCDTGGGNEVCASGMPETCHYRCGRMWTGFFADCQTVLSQLFGAGVDQYRDFTDACLSVDPVSITLALAEAE